MYMCLRVRHLVHPYEGRKADAPLPRNHHARRSAESQPRRAVVQRFSPVRALHTVVAVQLSQNRLQSGEQRIGGTDTADNERENLAIISMNQLSILGYIAVDSVKQQQLHVEAT